MTPFEGWKRAHSEEDFNKIIEFILRRSQRRYKKWQDIKCRKGDHGFNMETQVTPSGIHSRCKNCGQSWDTPNYHFM